jgi:hypothetical protein
MAYLLTQFIALLVDFGVLSQVLLDAYILGPFTTSLARRRGSRHHDAWQERRRVDELKETGPARTTETRKEMGRSETSSKHAHEDVLEFAMVLENARHVFSDAKPHHEKPSGRALSEGGSLKREMLREKWRPFWQFLLSNLYPTFRGCRMTFVRSMQIQPH